MDARGWSGHLLAHVHKKWALGEMTQLECLVNGANGIWASVCVGSISAVSRVRSLILPEKKEEGEECGLIFPNSGW